jgi:hypothetical protein
LGKSDSTKKVQVFDESDTKSIFDGKKEENLIKINPLLIFYGEIPIYYERLLTPTLSAEIGIGPTLSPGTLSETFSDIVEEETEEYTSLMGLTLKTSVRFYPDGAKNFPYGLYLGPEFRFKSYNREFEVPDGSQPNGGKLDIKSTYTDMSILGGYQNDIDNNFYIDYYLGVGIRSKKREFIDSEYDNLGNRTYIIDAKKSQVPLLSLGFKLGVSF